MQDDERGSIASWYILTRDIRRSQLERVATRSILRAFTATFMFTLSAQSCMPFGGNSIFYRKYSFGRTQTKFLALGDGTRKCTIGPRVHQAICRSRRSYHQPYDAAPLIECLVGWCKRAVSRAYYHTFASSTRV